MRPNSTDCVQVSSRGRIIGRAQVVIGSQRLIETDQVLRRKNMKQRCRMWMLLKSKFEMSCGGGVPTSSGSTKVACHVQQVGRVQGWTDGIGTLSNRMDATRGYRLGTGTRCIRTMAGGIPFSRSAAYSNSNHNKQEGRRYELAIGSRLSHKRSKRMPLSVSASLEDELVDGRSFGSEAYDASQIQVLQGLDPVRKRPGMYIGSTGQRGLHHLIYEILDNAIDEVQAGHADQVWLEMDMESRWVTIRDNGRGIPTDVHPVTGKSALETVLTVLHAGGKFGGDSSGYTVSGGLHGVGISVVNALSKELQVTVWRDGTRYDQTFAQGLTQTPLESTSVENGDTKQGTRVRFLYDDGIFSNTAVFDPETIRSRLRELAFLNPNATINFRVKNHQGKKKSQKNEEDENDSNLSKQDDAMPEDGWEVLHFSGGLAEYVKHINRDRISSHEPIVFSRKDGDIHVDVALQWCSDAFSDTLIGFVNSIKTIDGGTHMDGFKSALTRTVNSLGRKTKALKEGDPNLSGDHIREGLGAVVSVKVPSPEFEGQTKTRLGNPEVRKIVDNAVSSSISEALELQPSILSSVLSKAIQAYKAAEAAKKARDLVRRKSVLTKSTLPGKLADCSSNIREECEIFLVEGDSAGGSAKQARDRRFQAILPLRGKILNAEKNDDAKLYKNNEISSLIVGLGLGLKGEDLDSLRYGRIIILTDADVDGAHIRTLLLTFLFRYQRQLFENGHIYVGMPPLYRLEFGSGTKKTTQYCTSEEELRKAISRMDGKPYSIQRFKGLGEMMPEQLWNTTMNPETRMLKRLTVEDAAEASHMFTLLMGDKVGPRRELIEAHGREYQLDELDI